MNDQQAWESLDQLEAKYNELLAQANANIASLEQLCAEKDATLEASDSLLATYRQHDELQKAKIAQLLTALEQVAHYAPPDDHITNYEMMVAGAQLINLGQMARAILSPTE